MQIGVSVGYHRRPTWTHCSNALIVLIFGTANHTNNRHQHSDINYTNDIFAQMSMIVKRNIFIPQKFVINNSIFDFEIFLFLLRQINRPIFPFVCYEPLSIQFLLHSNNTVLTNICHSWSSRSAIKFKSDNRSLLDTLFKFIAPTTCSRFISSRLEYPNMFQQIKLTFVAYWTCIIRIKGWANIESKTSKLRSIYASYKTLERSNYIRTFSIDASDGSWAL